MIYELIPIYDRQRSFYRKALVINELGVTFLKSYDTTVCAINENGTFIRLWNGYSATTMRHINEFRLQNGMDKLSKADWLAL